MNKILLFVIASIVCGCKKEYDLPPVKTIPPGAALSLADVKKRLDSRDVYYFAGGDTTVYCTITADETSGSFYSQVFVRGDEGTAAGINLVSGGGLYCGDRIRINMNGLKIVRAAGMVMLDSVDTERSIVKVSAGNAVAPVACSMERLLETDQRGASLMQSQLVELSGVEFTADAKNKPIGDAVGHTNKSILLRTCPGTQVAVRTSGFANFAYKNAPAGNGKVTAVVTQYNSEVQLVLRQFADLQLTGPTCIPSSTVTTKLYHVKDFNDNNLGSNGWSSQSVTNSAVNWVVSTYSGTPTPFCRISGFVNSANADAESWLVSGPIDLDGAINPLLSFETAARYSGDPLEVLISESYSGGSPLTANWITLKGFALSSTSANFVWTPSGDISLTGYCGKTVRLAFKYRSTVAGASSYELDNVIVREQ